MYSPPIAFGPPSTILPKPRVPYVKGWRFAVEPHVTPPPTPVTRGCCLNSDADSEERRTVPPVERCLKHPPLPGQLGEPVPDTVQLRILEPLRVGDGHNAQVFTVRVQSGLNSRYLPQNQMVVAKIYDPLYFNDDNGYLNPFLCVDKHYTHETHAYKHLSNFQGVSIPKFYGSYSLKIPIENSRFRTVRLILMEFISGTSMQQTGPENFSQRTRKQFLRSIIDFESLVYERDIMLTDLFPRNVILVKSGCESKHKLIFIDFEAAIFGRIRDDPLPFRINLFLGQYVSPLLRWTRRSHNFREWIDWDWRPWVETEFAHTTATITPEMRRRYCD